MLGLLIFLKIKGTFFMQTRKALNLHTLNRKGTEITVSHQEIIQNSILAWQGQKTFGIIQMGKMNILRRLFTYNKGGNMSYRLEDLVEECEAQESYDYDKEFDEWMEMKDVGNEVIQDEEDEEDLGQLGK
jgi:hypothetical protein